MKILISDILATPTEVSYEESVDELNGILRGGGMHDYECARPLAVDVTFSRAQMDLFFDGRFEGELVGTCARCLETFPLRLANAFSVVLSPETPLSGEIELGQADLTQSFYGGKDVDVTRLVYEQVLLALPTQPLCAEECSGLCPRCGVNRNTESCSCTVADGDPRLAVLREMKIGRDV